jgi:hypothetical protein
MLLVKKKVLEHNRHSSERILDGTMSNRPLLY